MTGKTEPRDEHPGISKGVQSRAEMEEKVELNVLIKFIKPFDGSRDKLNPFISNCQNAYNLANKCQKPILFKYILSQLTERAESTCNIKEFESFEQFIEFLKQQFGERKHYTHLLSELQECKQGSSESVNQFSLKIETCLAKLITEINISIPTKKKAELAGRVAAMQDLALHTFTIGLQPRLSQIVRCRDPDTLNEAINFAVAEEKILSSLSRRNTNSFSGTADKGKFLNHREFQTRHNKYSPPQFRSEHARQHNTNSGNLVCRYCKNIGHTIENCRKRQYNNNKNRLNPPTSENHNNQTRNTVFQPSRKVYTVNPPTGDDEWVDEVDQNNLNE